jgi:5'-deoxynucleotidase YfbR-like HD superfamily hydrolase
MKLMSGRKYKNDLSDIIGILLEHKGIGDPISAERIDKAVHDLFGDWSSIPKNSVDFIDLVIDNDDHEALYKEFRNTEDSNREILSEFISKYPAVVSDDNVDEILVKARQIKNKDLILNSNEKIKKIEKNEEN